MARKMKDSGIEWIGEIPEGWEIVPVRSCFDEVRTKNTDGQEQNALQFKSGNIISKTNFNASMDDYVADTITNYTVVLPDTIMINGLNLNYDFKSLRVALVKEKGVITSAYLAIFPDRKKISPQYATYLFKGYETKMAFHNMGAGIRKTLGYKEFKNQPLLLPSKEEQNKISAYLDSKCSHIDIILSKIRSSIEEYKKLKQAVITQAVTKGVRGEREMKDSGVEWVSYIPVDWNTIKLKYCTYIRARLGWRALKADEYVESGFPFLSAFNIVNNALHFTNLNYINQFRYDESPEIRLKVGDVLLVKDGAGIGKCAIVENMPIPSTVNGSIAVISSTSFITPKYLYYYFLSEMFQQHIDLLKDGMGVPHLFQSDLKEIKIAFPSKDEQKEIADCLDAKCAEIDGLIAKKEQLAKELESYRKSLIYEVVTGKREV